MSASTAIPLPPPHPRALSILVVDDEETMLSIMAETLEGAGHFTRTATSADVAFFQLLHERPSPRVDLVICDIRMPGVDGPTLYQQVIAQRPMLAARFIFVTGGLVESVTADLINEGGARLLEKPFSSAQLLDAVGRLGDTAR